MPSIKSILMDNVENNKDVNLLKSRFTALKEPCIKAVIMFGSRARGEARDKSDIDLLILHEDYGIQDSILRRRHLYNLIRETIGEDFEDVTVIDMDLKRFLNPIEITSLLLNIYWDAVVLYDKTGKIRDFLRHVRRKIIESGLKRVRDGMAYRWILPKPMEEVKIL